MPERKTKMVDWAHLEETERRYFRNKWGDRSAEDWRKLEHDFKKLSMQHKNSMTPIMEMSISDICEWRLERSKALADGDTAAAKRLNDMVNAEIKRINEEKRTDVVSVDGFVTALESKGLLKDGELQLENVVDYVKKDKASYSLSRDALDMQMLAIVNTMRINSGQSELAELPAELQVQDIMGEFLEKSPPEEQLLMAQLDMIPQKQGTEGKL